jgi:integrase
MYAGLRRGELQALRVEDADLQAGVIRVCRSWDREHGVVDTKSRRWRTVPIAAALRAYLAEHLLGLSWTEGLVFGNGTPFDPVALTKRADAAWREAKLPRITLHECRHTFASLMTAVGVNAKALSEYLGHATITLTMDRYRHRMPGNEAETAGMLDNFLARAV